ncbi:MAG TPA: cytochrome c [Candidatus Dormibacteraeota bacterium]|nr:cytochrome c [Candidatus Dormibacteraeota bacterium]
MKIVLSCIFLLLPLHALPQDASKPADNKSAPDTKPAKETPKQENPAKPTPSSLALGKEMYDVDCALCHGADGSGITDLAKGMELKMPDFRDPASLKALTDGQMYSSIYNGKGKMPPEKGRGKPGQMWDLVNYVRSLAKK